MPKYMTKQRKALIEYLSNHTDEQLSARQIASDLADQGISLSAVYRNLSKMKDEGLLKICPKSGSREAFYQYIASDECSDRLHLSCKICGKTFHMKKADAERLIDQIAKNENFKLDKKETVLCGICENCSK